MENNKKRIKRKPNSSTNVKRAFKNTGEMVDFIENNFDAATSDKFKDFIYLLADNDNPKVASPMMRELTIYGGDLSSKISSHFHDVTGVYNPEQIPYSVMARMMRDPQIAMGYSVLSEPIRSLNWIVVCKDDYTKRLVTEVLRRIWNKFVKDTMLSTMYGCSVFEKVFKYEYIKIIDEDKEGKLKVVFDDVVVIYDKLKNVHLSTIKLDIDKKENYRGFIQNRNDGTYIKVPKNKSAVFTYDLKFGNYYGESLLRNVYKYWYWGELLYQFMLRYFEMCGSPPTIVVVPKGYVIDTNGVKKNNLQVGLELGQALISNSVAAIPYEADRNTNENMWNVKRLMDDRRGPMFIEAITHINVMKLLGLFVPENVATQNISEKEVFFFTQEGLISSIEDFNNEQIIPPIINYNIPKNKQTPCELQLDKMNYSRKMMLKELFVEMIRSLRVLQREGVFPNFYPDMQEVAEALNIPLKNYNDVFDNSNFVSKGKTERPGDVESDFDFEKEKFPKKSRGEQKESKKKEKIK